jgi:signal transduction histidine kinase
MGALGLYCDLLSMPGVLKPEHRHYAEEVRLLGSRSAAMIQQLMERRVQSVAAVADCPCRTKTAGESLRRNGWLASTGFDGQSGAQVRPVSLRAIAERCSGLLRRVACGRTIEIHYGAAASVPVRVPEEAVERILVNLVRNAAAALDRLDPAPDPALDALGRFAEEEITAPEAEDGFAADVARGAIRIGIGLLVNRVGDPQPWPFRRVRLTVEDAGCGMTPEQLERLLSGDRAHSRGSHGIGFRVVQELVGASNGTLRVMSSPGAGTRVQVEWPIAGGSSLAMAERDDESRDRAEGRESC